MAEENKPPAAPEESVPEETYENVDNFENFDEVDADSVDLGDDSFDEAAADFESEH